MKVTVTPIGAPSDGVGAAAGAYVDYLTENLERPESIEAAVGYYAGGRGANLVEGVGEWQGQGADRLGLVDEVDGDVLALLLQGRNPKTGERLTSAKGSAGRKNLKVGAPTRVVGVEPVWDLVDAEAALSVRGVLAGLVDRVPAAYMVETDGGRFFTQRGLRWLHSELADRDQRDAAATRDVFLAGPPQDWVTAAEVAEVCGVSSRYVGKLINTEDGPFPSAELRRERTWWIRRSEAIEFIEARDPPNVRVAFDCTSTVEKSVSVLGLVAEDERIRSTVARCVAEANQVAMSWLDQHASSGRARDASIGSEGLTVASFMHGTSRNDDPFLHCHNVVVNAIEDANGEGRTLDATGLYTQSKAAAAQATAHLRSVLTAELGVDWRRSVTGVWEIAGIDDRVIRSFSSRTKEIEEAMLELQNAGAEPDQDRVKKATRSPKSGVHPNQARRRWQQEAADLGFDAGDVSGICGGRTSDQIDSRELFDWLETPDGVCQDGPTFTYGDLLWAIADWAPANGRLPVLSPDRIEALAHQWLSTRRVHQIIDGRTGVQSVTGRALGASRRDVWTTEAMRQTQAQIRKGWIEGLGMGRGVAGPAHIGDAIGAAGILSAEQQALVWDWLGSGHMVQAAIGRPGTGKTTTMRTAVAAWEASGVTVVGAAVKGEAARILGKETGMDTNTVASYLTRWSMTGENPLDASTVLIVDEASTLSDWELHSLIAMTAGAGATLRLIGDVAQHGSVEAGGSWAALAKELGDATPELTQQRRVASPIEAEAAELVRHGEISAAVEALVAGGTVHQYSSWSDAYAPLVARWFHQREIGRGHPIVERRNEMRMVLNTLIQQVRVNTGEVEALVAVGERRFGVGDEVVARAPNRALHPTGDADAWIRNGATGHVVAHGRDALVVEFGDLGVVQIPLEWASEHVDLSYSVTSYAVQGATFDASSSALTAGATQAELLVNITRGRAENALFLVGDADAELAGLAESSARELAEVVAESVVDSSSETINQIDPAAGDTAALRTSAGELHLAAIRSIEDRAPSTAVDRARLERLRDIYRQAAFGQVDGFVDYFGSRPATPWIAKHWHQCAADVAAYQEEWGPPRSRDGKWSWLLVNGDHPTQSSQRQKLMSELDKLFVAIYSRQLDNQSVSMDQLKLVAGHPKRRDRDPRTVTPSTPDGTASQGADL